MSDGLEFRHDGAVARLTINRPDAGNMLTLEMIDALADMVADAGRRAETKAIVLRGAGADFCTGRDPAGAPERRPTTALEMRGALIEPILARTSQTPHGLRGAVPPTGQESRAARCERIGQPACAKPKRLRFGEGRAA